MLEKSKGIKLFLIIAALALGISQLGSFLIETNLPQNQTVKLTDFLHLTHVRNLGGVFGFFQGKGWMIAIISVPILAALVIYIWFIDSMKAFEYACFGLIVGGGMSNIMDRVIYGSVIDFIDVKGIPYWDYIFNTADTMIHLGIWPLFLWGLTHMKKEEETEPKGETGQVS